MGSGLADHAQAFDRRLPEVFDDLDGVGLDQFAISILFLDGQARASVVEAGMQEREDEASICLEYLTERGEHGFDSHHVHHALVADGGIEAVRAN